MVVNMFYIFCALLFSTSSLLLANESEVLTNQESSLNLFTVRHVDRFSDLDNDNYYFKVYLEKGRAF